MAEVEIINNNNGAEVTNTNNGGGVTQKEVVFTAVKTQLTVVAPKAAEAVTFYKAAFGAEEVSRTMHPKRKADQELPLVLSADLKIGPSAVFSVSDLPDDTASLAKTEGSGTVFIMETADVEGAIAKAIAAGAVAEGEITEAEGAGRVGKLKDPYGYIWAISSPAVKPVAAAADVLA